MQLHLLRVGHITFRSCPRVLLKEAEATLRAKEIVAVTDPPPKVVKARKNHTTPEESFNKHIFVSNNIQREQLKEKKATNEPVIVSSRL
ncbi:hypothetical protein OUZ56_013638 [Daphnia magna]|uniref:Uncharacterized protein n=1 Tax=Daphnia magna TaxID=35525 RepID=A0ABQ9Z6I5_9CRUS|nr:hypothetical protein OUZ56_013638 [Daphnia magna]